MATSLSSFGGGLVAVHGVTPCSTFSHFLLVRLGSGLGLGLGLGSGLGLGLGLRRREGHGNFVVVVWWWSGSRARRHTVLYIQQCCYLQLRFGAVFKSIPSVLVHS